MLLGSAEEQARLDSIDADARGGVGGTLLLRGEPGIGKSELLGYAAAQASDFRVLRATGVESETELPFSGLAELCKPVLELVGSIAQPQAVALSSALALGPATATDAFAIAVATLSLLAEAAEQQPVLAVVDDVPWMDSASRNALFFAARRLRAEPIAMLFAADDGWRVAFPGSGLCELTMRALDDRQTGALVEQASGRKVPERVAEQIHAGTGGNPLAILEATRQLSEAPPAGRALIGERLQ